MPRRVPPSRCGRSSRRWWYRHSSGSCCRPFLANGRVRAEQPGHIAQGDRLTEVRHGAPRLERVIGVGGLAASAVNCIVGSGIFGLPGLAAAILGPAAVLAYLLCALLVSLIGLCLAEAGSRVSHPGGLYAYATAAFGPVVGGIAGTFLWFANSVVTSAAVANLLVDTLAMGVPAFGVGVGRVVALVMLYAVF